MITDEIEKDLGEQSPIKTVEPQFTVEALPHPADRVQTIKLLSEKYPGEIPDSLEPGLVAAIQNRAPMSEFEISDCNKSIIEHEFESLNIQSSIYRKLAIYLEQILAETAGHFSFENIIKRYRQDVSLITGAKIGREIIESLNDSSAQQQSPSKQKPDNRSDDKNPLERQFRLRSFCQTETDDDGYRVFRPPAGLADQTTTQLLTDIHKKYLQMENMAKKVAKEPEFDIEKMGAAYAYQICQPTGVSEYFLRLFVKDRFRQLLGLDDSSLQTISHIRDLSPWEIDSLIWSPDWHRDPLLIAAVNRGDNDETGVAEEESRRLEAVEMIESGWPAKALEILQNIRSQRDQIYQQSLSKIIFNRYRAPFNDLVAKYNQTEDKIREISSHRGEINHQIHLTTSAKLYQNME